MELVLVIAVVVACVVVYYSRKPKDLVEAEQAPYKVEAAPTVQAEINSVADQATQAVVESIAPAKPARKPRAPAAKKVAAKKTARKPKAS
jgi:uncharacterized protein YdaL